jgi:hypothetical protein
MAAVIPAATTRGRGGEGTGGEEGMRGERERGNRFPLDIVASGIKQKEDYACTGLSK